MKHKKEEQAIQVRFPLDVLNELRQYARQHERSFNGEVIWGLRQYLAQHRKDSEDGDDATGRTAPD